jgi:glyoxylase-like metal-dependent hydrolase (beta-lactamase superfamily II)
MEYTIKICRNGTTKAPGPEIFYLKDWDKEYTLVTYLFIVRGGGHTMLVDTGCGDIEPINRMLHAEFGGKISFDLPQEETTGAILAREGVDPAQVDHVFVSHLHHDHAGNVDLFPNAKLVLSRHGWLEYAKKERPYYYAEALFPSRPIRHIASQPADKLLLVDGECEVLPGISCFWVGGHTPCCLAVQVNTARGRVVFTSDVAFFERNVTEEHPIGMFYNLWECHEAYKQIKRRADIIVTSHDPGVLARFPDGRI